MKRYSSGMYVRLAFAVAAHLEPEILIVDEVLAVGDAAFQKKCLGKMEDVARAGPHGALRQPQHAGGTQSLCSAVQIEAGQSRELRRGGQVVAEYLAQQADTGLLSDGTPGGAGR